MAEFPISGGCLCGEVRFEVAEPPLSAAYCHCIRCQRRTGSASSCSARLVPGSLRILSGEELIRCWEPPGGFAKCFCSGCGAHLWSRDPADPQGISVRMGAFEGDPGVRPSYRQFTAYACDWEPIPDDGLPRYPERKPA